MGETTTTTKRQRRRRMQFCNPTFEARAPLTTLATSSPGMQLSSLSLSSLTTSPLATPQAHTLSSLHKGGLSHSNPSNTHTRTHALALGVCLALLTPIPLAQLLVLTAPNQIAVQSCTRSLLLLLLQLNN